MEKSQLKKLGDLVKTESPILLYFGKDKMMTNTFIICNNEDEIESNKSYWGNQWLEISDTDIAALLKGKTLTAMVNDEYGVFIKMGDST